MMPVFFHYPHYIIELDKNKFKKYLHSIFQVIDHHERHINRVIATAAIGTASTPWTIGR